MDDKFLDNTAVPYQMVRRLVTISLIFGLAGGVIGSYLMVRYLPGLIPVDKRQVVLQENSAVIDVVKKVGPSVVSITTQSTGSDFFGFSQIQQSGAGTGIILSADGLIMTNAHVASADTTSYSVFTSDGKEYKGAKVVARDANNDVAFLRISASGLKPIELGDSSSVLVGQRVVAIGNALGRFANTATEGIVSGLGRPVVAGGGGETPESLQNLIQTDAAINPGNSGGPLVNLSGQLIGMNTAVAGNAQNIGFAIPTSELQSAIASVKSQGKIVKPYLGVRYIEITPEFATSNNLKVSEGAYVAGSRGNLPVVPNSPAAKAGLKEGDIITKIGDGKIDKTHSLSSLVSKHKVGDKIALSILRDDKEQNLDVTLEEAPAG